MEAYEKKEMLKLFIRGMMYVEDQRTKQQRSNLPKNELFQSYSVLLAQKIKTYQQTKMTKGMTQPPLVRVHDVLVENVKEKAVRTAFVVDQKQFTNLLEKSNPGQIDFYKAVFVSGELKGELFMLIDQKVKDMIDTRLRIGLEPIDLDMLKAK